MPIETILGAGSLSGILVAAVIAVAVYVLQKHIDLVAVRIQKDYEDKLGQTEMRLKSELERAQAQFEATLALTSQIDQDLRERRLRVYPELWVNTQILPLWPQAEGVTYGKLQAFSLDLQNWYFRKGGMFLSKSSREAYGAVQEALKQLAEQEHPIEDVIAPEDYDHVRKFCSALRTAMAQDVESRRLSPIAAP